MYNKLKLISSNSNIRYFSYIDNIDIILSESNGVWNVLFKDETYFSFDDMYSAINFIENLEK